MGIATGIDTDITMDIDMRIVMGTGMGIEDMTARLRRIGAAATRSA
jgi:hypothetical protein